MTPPTDPGPINPLCRKCLRECKQPANCLLLSCPRYLPLPFKIEQPRFQQLDLFPRRKKRD
ncbi:MAG: hypothetical protein RQ723_00730 [Desulfuromonadales bacterium]|nr:hypothetical protein [Desulfuromonadales bacterium]